MLPSGEPRSRHLLGKRKLCSRLDDHTGLRVEKKVARCAAKHGVRKRFFGPCGAPASWTSQVFLGERDASAARAGELSIEGVLYANCWRENVLVALDGLPGKLGVQLSDDPGVNQLLQGRRALLHGAKE